VKCNVYIKLTLKQFFIVNNYIYTKLILKQSFWIREKALMIIYIKTLIISSFFTNLYLLKIYFINFYYKPG